MEWGGTKAEIAAALADVGFAVTLEGAPVEGGPDYDPRIGYAPTYSIKALDRGIRKVRSTDSGEERTLRTLLMAAGSVTPARGWRVKIGEDWFRIAEVTTVAPGGVALTHALALEG